MDKLEEAIFMAEHLERIVKSNEQRPMMQHIIVLMHEVKRLRGELEGGKNEY
jgi:hypothetical protein